MQSGDPELHGPVGRIDVSVCAVKYMHVHVMMQHMKQNMNSNGNTFSGAISVKCMHTLT